MSIIKIQASIAGYNGSPKTVFAAYSNDSGILVIAKCEDLIVNRQNQCAVITNIPEIDRDAEFSEDNFKEAIEAYQMLENTLSKDRHSNRIVMNESVKSTCNLVNAIQVDKIEASGTKYQLNQEITNAQVATLAVCFYTVSLGAVALQMKMAEDLIDLAGTFYSADALITTI